jgi:hypothetical protein
MGIDYTIIDSAASLGDGRARSSAVRGGDHLRARLCNGECHYASIVRPSMPHIVREMKLSNIRSRAGTIVCRGDIPRTCRTRHHNKTIV